MFLNRIVVNVVQTSSPLTVTMIISWTHGVFRSMSLSVIVMAACPLLASLSIQHFLREGIQYNELDLDRMAT